MKKALLTLFVFCLVKVNAQYTMKWPLDTPWTITGNYGELRPNHFHAGIDLSTGGRVNRKVYAAESGYVSRIRVSATGYGNAIYITHPGGLVTVYGHLNSLGLKMAKPVADEQESRKSFEVELLPAPNAIPVKKGEIIGLSGNTGGSAGPHLHFEVRDEKSETPLNPFFHFNVQDKIPPILEALAFYDLSDSLNPVLMRTTRIHPALVSQSFVVSRNPVGIAFAGYDQLKREGNKNNIYNVKLFFDEKLIYEHSLRSIDFADNRYVNEFSETTGKLKLQKCFVPTSFPPRLYDSYIRKGVITFNDTTHHKIKLVLEDEKGNKTTNEFRLRTTASPSVVAHDVNRPLFVNCNKDFVYKTGNSSLYIPASTFYRSVELTVDDRLFTDSRLIVGPSVNMRTAYVVGCLVPPDYTGQNNKLVLRSSAGVSTGVARNDSVFFYLKSTGTFVLMADLDAPLIRTALSPQRIHKIKKFTSFSFKISDKLSGISKYAVYINDKWVLAAFDAKSDTLTYVFDERTPAGKLDFVVEAEDRCGNKKKFSYTLVRM
jgi:hypothetical protein